MIFSLKFDISSLEKGKQFLGGLMFMEKVFVVESPIPEMGPTHFLAVPEGMGEPAIIKDVRLKVGDRIVPTKIHRNVHSGGQKVLHIHSAYWVYAEDYPRWRSERILKEEEKVSVELQRKEKKLAEANQRKNRKLGLVDAPFENEERQSRWDCQPKNFFRGGKAVVVRTDENLLKYANDPDRDKRPIGGTDYFHCLECKDAVYRGQRAVLVFDRYGHRRAAFCSPRCQIHYALDIIANRRLARLKK